MRASRIISYLFLLTPRNGGIHAFELRNGALLDALLALRLAQLWGERCTVHRNRRMLVASAVDVVATVCLHIIRNLETMHD